MTKCDPLMAVAVVRMPAAVVRPRVSHVRRKAITVRRRAVRTPRERMWMRVTGKRLLRQKALR